MHSIIGAMTVAAGHQDLVLFLIQHGATIDRYGGFGLSPLVTAVHLVELLRQNGADSGFRCHRNMNALKLAAKKELKDVVDITWTRSRSQLPIHLSSARQDEKPRGRVPITVLPEHATPEDIESLRRSSSTAYGVITPGLRT